MRVKEFVKTEVKNPVIQDFSKPFLEHCVSDLPVSSIRAIYPMIRAINSDRLTRNFTFYPRESLMGEERGQYSTGYSSFVKPFGKPIITEHNLQGDMLQSPDVPMGRIIYSSYIGSKEGAKLKKNPNKGFPGFEEGSGYLRLIPAITSPEGIERVLGGIYHTVSIGADVTSAIESISGIDIAKALRDGTDLPEYIKGQEYDGKLSFLTMGSLSGRECSYVNAPSDTLAKNEVTDIGWHGVQLLLGEKSVGKESFSFYDANTLQFVEMVDLNNEKMGEAWDLSFQFVDSAKIKSYVEVSTGDNKQVLKIQEFELDSLSITNTQTETQDTEEVPEETQEVKESKMSKPAKGYKIELTLEEAKTLLAEQGFLDLVTDEFVSGESTPFEFAKPEVFAKISEAVLQVTDQEWDTDNATLALGEYLKSESGLKLAEAVDTKLSVRDLFGTGVHVQEAVNLQESTVVKSNLQNATSTLEFEVIKSLFVDKEHDEFPVILTDIRPLFISVKTAQEAQDVLDAIGSIEEDYKLTEDQKNLVKERCEALKSVLGMVEAAGSVDKIDFSTLEFTTPCTPLSLGKEFTEAKIAEMVETEKEMRKYLIPLVGLIRKNKISKEAFDEATLAYEHFGNTILKKWLASIPTESTQSVTEQPQKPEVADVTEASIEQVGNPFAAMEETTETTVDTKDKPSGDTMVRDWKLFASEAKPKTKRSGSSVK